MHEASRVILLVGLPGAGKSSWLAARALPSLSTDAVRGLLSDDITNQNIHGRVFSTVRYLLRQRLAIGCSTTYVDATHLTRAERMPYFQIADWYNCHLEALFFPVTLSECLHRNAARQRVVPPDVIIRMAAKLQVPELWEGFTRVSIAEVSSSSPGATAGEYPKRDTLKV